MYVSPFRAANDTVTKVLLPLFTDELEFERVKDSAESYFEHLPFDEISYDGQTSKVYIFGIACEVLNGSLGDDRKGLVVTVWTRRPKEEDGVDHAARVMLANLAAAAAHTVVLTDGGTGEEAADADKPAAYKPDADKSDTDKPPKPAADTTDTATPDAENLLGLLDARKRQTLRKKLLTATIPIGDDRKVYISNFIDPNALAKTEVLLTEVVRNDTPQNMLSSLLVELATLLATLGYAFVDSVPLASSKSTVARRHVGISYDATLVKPDGILMANGQRLETEAQFKRWHLNQEIAKLEQQRKDAPRERADKPKTVGQLTKNFNDVQKQRKNAVDEAERGATEAAEKEKRYNKTQERELKSRLNKEEKGKKRQLKEVNVLEAQKPIEEEIEALGPLGPM